MSYSKADIEDFKATLLDSYGFKSEAEIRDVAGAKFGRSDDEGVVLLLKALHAESLRNLAAARAEYYGKNPRERAIDLAVNAMIVNG